MSLTSSDWIRDEAASRGCAICGHSEHPEVLEWHHINPEEKLANVTSLAGAAPKRLWAEMCKCVVLCANCHRRLHAGTVQLPT